MRKAGPLALVLFFIMLAQVAPAWPHAQVLTTTPAQAEILATAPAQARLDFNEPVNALAVALIAPDGAYTDLLSATTSGQAITVALPAGLGEGTHVLSWRVVSLDSHPIAGSLLFSIGHSTGAQPLSTASADSLAATALWAAKALLFMALLFGVGGAVFALAAPLPAAARPVLIALSGAGLVLAPLSLGLQGLDALGLGLIDLAAPGVWRAGWSTSFGLTAACAALAFVVALMALAKPWRGLGWLAWLLGALALALSGHASAAQPQWLTRPAVFVHLGGLLFWIGALLPLGLHLQANGPKARLALARFSRVVPWAVAPILVSGMVLAAIQMGPPGGQWLSFYGAILAAKLGLLAVLFALALVNRLKLTAPAMAGDGTATSRLKASIWAEIGIVLLVLLLVAGWRFTPPPRALAAIPAVAAEPMLLHLMDGNVMAMGTLDSAAPGVARLDLAITDAVGTPLAPQGVSVTLSAPALGIEPIVQPALDMEGAWRVEPLIIPLPGTWELQLDIRVSRFSLVTLRETLVID